MQISVMLMCKLLTNGGKDILRGKDAGDASFLEEKFGLLFRVTDQKKDRVAKYKGTLQFIKMLDSLHCFKFIHMMIPNFFLS